MINNPKDIQEVLNVIDNVTKEQLDEAIRRADGMNEEETIQKLWDIAITSTFETKDYPNRVVMKDDLLVLLKSYEQEKEKNKKLETLFGFISDTDYRKVDEFNKLINNLAQAIRFMSTNEKLTVEDIIKEFSKENTVTEEFMERWEKSQHEESHLKDKVIDLMAEDISMDNCLKVMEGACKRIKDCYQEMEGNISCEQCAKEYYFKKARGEGNE